MNQVGHTRSVKHDIPTMIDGGDLAGLIAALDDPANHVVGVEGCVSVLPELADGIASLGRSMAPYLAESLTELNQASQSEFLAGKGLLAVQLLQRARLRLEVLARFQNPWIVRTLLDALTDGIEIQETPSQLDDEAACLEQAARIGLIALGDLGIEKIEELLPLIKNPRVREGVIDVLEQIGTGPARRVLRLLLNDPNPLVQQRARQALSK